MEEEVMLGRVFSEIGEKYGYEKVEAAFVGFKDFKVRWRATGSI